MLVSDTGCGLGVSTAEAAACNTCSSSDEEGTEVSSSTAATKDSAGIFTSATGRSVSYDDTITENTIILTRYLGFVPR